MDWKSSRVAGVTLQRTGKPHIIVLGNEMGRLKPNWFAGIRTPWTLSDPENWRRTHRFGGKVFFLAGLLIVVASLLLPPTISFFVLMTSALGAAALSIGYSYVFWRQHSGATAQLASVQNGSVRVDRQVASV